MTIYYIFRDQNSYYLFFYNNIYKKNMELACGAFAPRSHAWMFVRLGSRAK